MDIFLNLGAGLLTGFLVAMPPGAIAVVSIQRTLAKNRKSGFASGLGAATANTISATVAAFFLSIVLPFIEENMNLLKILCGFFIIILGIAIFNKKNISLEQNGKTGKNSLWNDYLSVFLIALPNPGFILTFMAFFAFFGINPEISYFHGLWLVLGVFAGVSLWWFCLTSYVNVLRKKFQSRHITYINRIAGILVIILGLVIISS
ncbi:MAG: LysE family translocator [Tannerella sp.]|jgi:threonine/homoserine/homoserine lactone efflux protein|nr:LysE family translocator [Tannerella sp.]